MAFKGILGKRRLMNPTLQTPGFGDGIQEQVSYGLRQQPQEPKKPSFFGEGGIARGIAGTIGDVLLNQNGSGAIYAPAMHQKRRQEFQQSQYEQQREARMQDFYAKEQFKAANPTPQGPTAQQRNFEYYQGLDPTQRKDFGGYLDAVTPKLVTGADGRVYPVRRDQQAPTAPIGKLRPVGGQTQPASGNFR